MSDIKLVDIEKVSTLEEYAQHLVIQTISLSTLARLQIVVAKKGLLDNVEEDIAANILHETKRIGQSIQRMMDAINERCPIEVEAIVKGFKEKV